MLVTTSMTQLLPSLDFFIPFGQLPLTVLVAATVTQADDEVDPAGEVVPLGQEVQVEAPAAEYVPAAQVVQDEAPAAENFPAAQAVQDEAPAEEYFPAGQVVQDEAPAEEYVPAAQVEQDVLVFVPALYVPAEQL